MAAGSSRDHIVTGTVRVVTWNLWWRFGPWRERQPAITSALRDAASDVLTLQEVWAGADDNQAHQLGESLGLPHLAWSPNRRSERWRRRIAPHGDGLDVGNAILSRWPILSTEEVVLPDAGAAEEGRTVLAVVVRHPDGPLPVLTTHLSSHPALSATRVAQVEEVARLADRTARSAAGLGGDPFPPVVTGDFNSEPESDEMRRLSGTLTAPAVDGLVLVDAWRLAQDADPGWTWRRENPYLSEGNPNARIDYVLAGLGGAKLRGRVVDVGLVGAGPVDGVWPSDHAGVRADLRV